MKRKLNERFNSSMPKWLQSAFISWGLDDTADIYFQDKAQKYNSKGFDVKKPDATFSDKAGGKGPNNILAKLRALGIDLENAKFVEVDLNTNPLKSNKSSFEKNDLANGNVTGYLPFYYLKGTDNNGDPFEQVYADGLNDKEYFKGQDVGKYKHYMLGFISRKDQLLPNVVGFCYLNLDDPSNFIKTPRMGAGDPSLQVNSDTNRDLHKDYLKDKEWRDSHNLDASGYVKNLVVDRYSKQLRQIHRDKLADRLESLGDTLNNIASSLTGALNKLNIRDPESIKNTKETFIAENAINKFLEAHEAYQQLQIKIETALKSQNPDDIDALVDEVYKESNPNGIAALTKTVKELERILSKYNTVKVSWSIPRYKAQAAE